MSWSDVVVTLDSWEPTSVTLSCENPQEHPNTARFRLVVHLQHGTEALESPAVTLDPGQSFEFELIPSGEIISITDDPEPFAP